MNRNIKHDQRVDTLGNTGMSVFRSVEEAQSIPISLDVNQSLQDVPGVVVRGLGPEKPLAANILSLREVRNSRPIGRLAVSEALDEVYEELTDLRRGYWVEIEDVDFIRTNIRNYIALILNRDRIAQERQEIADVLRRLSDVPVEESLGLQRYTPHISICSVSANTGSRVKEWARRAVADNISERGLELKRATLYTPPRRHTTKQFQTIK